MVDGRNKFFTFDAIKSDVDKFFSAIDYVSLISLSTGEVWLHPDFKLLLEYISYNYSDKYNNLSIVTNGTVLPKGEVLNAIAATKTRVFISNYSNQLNTKSRISELEAILQDHDIPYEVWNNLQSGRYDTPMFSSIGDIKIKRNRVKDSLIKLYQQCANNACYVVKDGKIFGCGAAPWANAGGLYDPAPEDSVSLEVNKNQIAEFFIRSGTEKHLPVCDFCDGIGPDVNNTLIPAGAQLKKMWLQRNN
jgi:hypothetical protein